MKKIIISFFLTAVLVAIPYISNATGISDLRSNLNTFGSSLGYSNDSNLTGKIAIIINIALGFLGIVGVILIMYSGFKWMTAQGNEDEVTKAKSTIKNAAIGIAIIFLSYVIVNFVVSHMSNISGGNSNKQSQSGTKACVYIFTGCNPLCVEASSCQSTYVWPACTQDTVGNLQSQQTGTCFDKCTECSIP